MSNEQLVGIVLGKDLNNAEDKEDIHSALKKLTRSRARGMSVRDAKADQPLQQIEASIELSKRLNDNGNIGHYASPENIWQVLRDIHRAKKEHFIVLFLDTRNQEIKRELVSMGTVNTSMVHPREVFKEAISANAVSIILAHNHPSNKTDPSDNDISVTRRLVEAGNLIGIEVIDHIIVASSGYYSFRHNNLI